jgi:GNAT superfamily N-acetyltransferase
MEITKQSITGQGVRFSVKDGDKEIGRAYLYLLTNDLHEAPFGFLEDVMIEEAYRNQGIGQKLIPEIMKEAKERGCYKLIGTSRYEREGVHKFYEKLGFKDYGKEFRLDL